MQPVYHHMGSTPKDCFFITRQTSQQSGILFDFQSQPPLITRMVRIFFFVGREGPFSFLPCLIDFVDAASRSRRAPDCWLPHNTSFVTVNCSFLVTANAGHKYYHAMLNTEMLDQQGDQSRHQPSQTPLLFASGKSPLMWYVNKERTIYMANH